MHEEVAGARAPSTLPFALFVLTLLLPLAAAIWLLTRAEHSVIGADETIRTLLRAGLTEPVMRHYLEQQVRPQLPKPIPLANKPTALPPNRPRSSHTRQPGEQPTPSSD